MEDDKLNQKFQKIDERFDGVYQRLDGVDQRLEGIDVRLDKMTDLLLDHGTRLEKIEEKMPKLDLIDGIVQSQDEILKILYRMEAEQAANKSRSDRHEERIETLEHDVKKIQVAIA